MSLRVKSWCDILRANEKEAAIQGGAVRSSGEPDLVSRIAHRVFFLDEEEKKNRYLVPLMAKGLVRRTLPDKPKSRFQRYALA